MVVVNVVVAVKLKVSYSLQGDIFRRLFLLQHNN